MKRITKLAIPGLALATLFLFAACGSSSSSTPQSDATITPASSDATATDDSGDTIILTDSDDDVIASQLSEAAASASVPATSVATDRVFTTEELAQYNGKNGEPAYVAVDGIVYDVTDSYQWRNGEHEGHQAGQDLTSEIQDSPHGVAVLDDLPVVGTLES